MYCLYVNCFCTVWSTLSRISLTKAHVLWWCDSKLDLIWFDLKWLVSPFPEDVWAWWLLMHWLQLQFTPCKALPSVWIGFASQYSQACGHPCCLCTLSYPISSFQSTLHLICFDTLLPPLSLMILCVLPSLWKVSIIIFWTIAKSSPLLWFQRTRDTQNLYCIKWSLIETQM